MDTMLIPTGPAYSCALSSFGPKVPAAGRAHGTAVPAAKGLAAGGVRPDVATVAYGIDLPGPPRGAPV